MTESEYLHRDEPKKSLRLRRRPKPVGEVDASVCRIYMYPMRVRDMTNFWKLEPADGIYQVTRIFARISGLNLETDGTPKRIPLDPEIRKTLSDEV